MTAPGGASASTPGRLILMVEGIPVPQGSKKLGRNIGTGKPMLLDVNGPALRQWRATVHVHARQERIRFAAHVPLRVSLLFSLPRPRTVRRAEMTTKPDIDKLSRAVLDALTDAEVWADDAQVVTLTASKTYSELGRPGCLIEVREATA